MRDLGCVKQVLILVIGGRINYGQNSRTSFSNIGLCVSGGFMNLFHKAFTTVFTPLFDELFNLLRVLFMPNIHTTNKDNNILYKLIITN